MPLYELLSAERVAILGTPGDRNAVLETAARLLSGGDPRTAAALDAGLRERERLASTAIGHGVAIPHGRSPLLETGCGAFLRLAQPVDFGAADGEPVDLVLAMAVPEHHVQQHLQLLAELAERFADPAFRDCLRSAPDAAQLSQRLLQQCKRSAA
ncbi:PTS sugar transporter subunit IIA [Lysobacter enzymogenes]|uniref:PTS sugar transporter subunit IIA n=1 Tax=Lysobacter enzymogenes TaxID=69 RepID=UPI001A956B39|nr:PTS sugar transporter subunit IIA [Lysobacter enzymogenes]QQP95956.1 PTS sugar transporter subunit IIA [Lysobacter enzymogenes]